MKKIAIAAVLMLLAMVPLGRGEHLWSLFEQALYSEFSLGKGAAAWGMGGTALALPGDPFVSSWNPAGLADLTRPWLAFSFSADKLNNSPGERHFSFPMYGRAAIGIIQERASKASGQSVEFISMSLPLTIFRHRVVLQLSRRRQESFSAGLDYGYQYTYRTYYSFDYDYRYKLDGSGGFDLYALSLASEVVRGVRVGVNIQYWTNGFRSTAEESYEYRLQNYYGGDLAWRDDFSDSVDFRISGFSLDAGILINLGTRIQAGLVFRSGCTAGLDFSNSASFRNGQTGLTSENDVSGSGKIKLPPSVGMGFSYRPSRNTILAADLGLTFWSKGRLLDYRRASSGGAVPEPRDYAFPSMRLTEVIGQKDTLHFHGGMEHRFRMGAVELPLRFGLFLDEHYYFSDSGSAVKTFGYSLGFGFRWRQVALDAAWVKSTSESRFGRDLLRASMAYGF